MLGHALLQHQHIGVLPTSEEPVDVLPLQDPSTSTTMPESWVRFVRALGVKPKTVAHIVVVQGRYPYSHELIDSGTFRG